jgi:hypothetical protein
MNNQRGTTGYVMVSATNEERDVRFRNMDGKSIRINTSLSFFNK